ncbi:Uncharacterised protein [Vibrio cholerae]|nr:Uncharacterised protein [Vibrio cholerae]
MVLFTSSASGLERVRNNQTPSRAPDTMPKTAKLVMTDLTFDNASNAASS